MMITPWYVSDYVLFGRNTIRHALSVVVIISHSFLFSFVLYSAAKATSNLDVIPCHVLLCFQ